MTKLTPKQAKFCAEYLIDLNGTQAAIRAGYSARTAKVQAAENLTKPDIQARISELIADREARIERTGDEVLKRLWEVADLKVVEDVGTIENGEFKIYPSDVWSEATKRVVRSIKNNRSISKAGEELETSIKAPEVMPALIELMKYHGLTSDFNQAIACLRKYGLWVTQDDDGLWRIEDKNVSAIC